MIIFSHINQLKVSKHQRKSNSATVDKYSTTNTTTVHFHRRFT
jgi:hypothetical protein